MSDAMMRHHHKPVVVLSPHLDDAVLGCGALLACHPSSVVVTVFAGIPDMPDSATDWDAASGFNSGTEAMHMRRREDEAGLATLGVTPRWLDYLDAQYGEPVDPEVLAEGLAHELERLGERRIFIPMGLFHDDHKTVHDAAVLVMRDRPHWQWFAYEEPMYREVNGQLDERLKRLRERGIVTRCIGGSPEAPLEKQHALVQYRSQLTALSQPGGPGFGDAMKPERYWKLRPQWNGAYA